MKSSLERTAMRVEHEVIILFCQYKANGLGLGVPCSGRVLRLTYLHFAGVIQLVECQLPKLDVTGSSPVARSFEVLKFQILPVAGSPPGPGDFFLGPVPGPVGALIFAAKRARCSGVSPANRASRSTDGFVPLASGFAPNRSSRRTFAASVRSSSV